MKRCYNIDGKPLKKTDGEEVKKGNFVTDWVIPILLAILVGLAVNKWLVMRIIVPTPSMEKTIMTGDVMYVTKVYNPSKLERGDIVVFYANTKSSEQLAPEKLIKRLIGKPGDTVEVKDGLVYVNGNLISEPYVNNNEKITKTFVVPQGKYLFFGDNRKYSNDARKWDNPFIDEKDIIAKAGFRVRPLDRIGFVK